MSDIDSLKGFNPGGGGLFLKLSDGDTVRVRITSLPVIFQNTFIRGEEESVSTAFGFVVWNHETNSAQIWQTNGATYGQQIAPLLEDEEYGDWREYDVKISRTGEKQQTRYSVRPGVKRYKLNAEQLHTTDDVDIIGTIAKNDHASHVMWLTDYKDAQEAGINPKEQSGYDRAKEARNKVSTKVEAKDIEEAFETELNSEEPINLDDIPF